MALKDKSQEVFLMNCRLSLAAVIVISALSCGLSAQTIAVTDLPGGYTWDSIVLPDGFSGALASDVENPDIIYASVGGWQAQYVVRVHLSTGSVEACASGLFGSIGGLAVPGPNQLVIIDNHASPGSGIPGETILLCSDVNTDGDFDDPFEIVELIAPLTITPGDFTGAQARLVPPGNPSGFSSGALMYQTADGALSSGLYLVTEPTSTTTAAYRPAGAPVFPGFDYNGGFDFVSNGHLYMGAANSSWTGEVFAFVNLNADETIGPGELNDIVTSTSLTGGISDLVSDGEDDLFIITNPWGGAQVQTFRAPANPLTGHVVPEPFASTDSAWLRTALINSKSLPFEPLLEETGAPQAALILGGYGDGWAQAKNLIVIRPDVNSGVSDWRAYR